MDDMTLKIAMAGLLHDIGKFAEDGIDVSAEFLDSKTGLYQPCHNGCYTHRHTVYTAAFIDQFEKLMPAQFSRARWGMEDTFINLTSGHHKPETPLQWIVAMADCISSGWNRNNFDKEYNQATDWQDYKQLRLLPIFEALLREDKEIKEIKDYKYHYPLKEISPANIFPGLRENIEPENRETAAAEYKKLFDEFINAMGKIRHKEENIKLWFEHFESLMLTFTSAIPAARAGNVVPDVSLYDHSKSVAALAAALYLYHRNTDTMSVKAICDCDLKKFLLISGDFYGIQNFIFSDSGEAGKRRSKILRGRSFAVSLLCELAADMICRTIGLPSTSILLNAAGKFTIVSHNTQTVRQAVKDVEFRVNNWLIKNTCGESAIGISTIEAAPENFIAGKFSALYDLLAAKMAERKFGKFDLDRYGGTVDGFLNDFDNNLKPPLCPYCGKRPSHQAAESFKETPDDKSMCRICRDHIFLGKKIVTKDRIAITTKGADIHNVDSKLLEPIFGEYQAAFIDGDLRKMASDGQLLKYWDISIDLEGNIAKDVTSRFINGYVPIYKEEDNYDDQARTGVPITFEHIACKALNLGKEGRFTGIQALGILKADVDQLGLLMSCGIKEKHLNISRLATLSRQLNFFFAVFLPHLLKTDPSFLDIYTVFAGGDDLFLIGPWNRVIELAGLLQKRFADYTCHNPEVHFSAGITLQKPHTPLHKLSEDTENALEKAKVENPDKHERGNCVNLFGETVTWNDFAELRNIAKLLNNWREEGQINNAMLFRINRFIGMAAMEKEIDIKKGVQIEDMECLKWHSYLKYTAERNIGKHTDDEKEKKTARQEFNHVAVWLEKYGGRLKIALWDVIYNNR